IASNAGQLRAARPEPPYTIRSSGRSATSGSRLFISIRSAASCGQPLQESVTPRGALIWRLTMSIVDEGPGLLQLPSRWRACKESRNVETYARVVNSKLKNFLLDFHLTRRFKRSSID